MITFTQLMLEKLVLLNKDKQEITDTLVKEFSVMYLLLNSSEVSQFTDTGILQTLITFIPPMLTRLELLNKDKLEIMDTLVKVS